jgi:hypothetical protein
MKVELKKFGTLLISRPAGRDAFLAFKAYQKPTTQSEPIELDFSGVQVIGPSWLDEFVSGIRESFPSNKIAYLPSKNPSVIQSIKTIEEE